jgi:hypothetical protein
VAGEFVGRGQAGRPGADDDNLSVGFHGNIFARNGGRASAIWGS